MTEAALVASALVVGVVIGLTGIGGGSLMTPLLILVFNIAAPVAVATDLFFAAATKIVGAGEYARKKLVDWGVTGLLWLGSLPASLLTSVLMPASGAFAPTIQKVLSFALLLTAAVILLRPQLRRWFAADKGPVRSRAVLLVLFGALLGGLVTISSVGAGALGLALLAALYPDRSMAQLVGVDLAHTVVLSAVAGAGHWALGRVDFALLGLLLLGSIPGVWLGARSNRRLSERLIAGLLLGVGGWLGYTTLTAS